MIPSKEFDHIRNVLDAISNLRAAMRQFIQKKIREGNYDITYEMMQLLLVLWRGHEVNQQEIANLLIKNKASITPLIDNLSKRKLVVRTEDPSDRRNKIIALTKAGREYMEAFTPALDDFFRRIETDISLPEMEQVSALLHKMRQNLTS
ncbi:MarR family winged helix-turn-helix transcriptional regulator [Chitinophaga deserti]|uniref:MarR family winged helix-turn-helix transcriptional regulator n=1 Tax=Chitinophaga deserti TaxID=2164099 RepID=UPI000D6C1367|nr:MarR family winged helix-turn-helix transcriptional regulator [Chitinophaga deserti]